MGELKMNGGKFETVTNEEYINCNEAQINTSINSDLVDTRGEDDVCAN